ncbi:MAG: hypothetical protein OHK0019_20110 [Saprospiraceae bacterium]
MIDIFIAYSHNDLPLKDELKKFLRPMLREGRISLWDDFDIEAGQDWDAKIKERLYSADIVLLLVSADSLASDYFYGKEVKVSLERHVRGEAIVVPVVLRHCDWIETPLGSLEALPEKGRPVSEWPSRDQAFQDIVSRLRRVVESREHLKQTEAAQAEAHRQFEAACLAADQLFQKKNWAEARAAYTSALTLYRPGFAPDRAVLQAKIADCNAQIAEETRQVSQRQRAEKERLVREKRKSQTASVSPVGNFRLLAGIGAGAALVALLLLWQPWKQEAEKTQQEQGQTSIEQPGEKTPSDKPAVLPLQPDIQAAFEQARDSGTIAAMQRFIDRYPNAKRAAADEHLEKLKRKVAAMLKEADALVRLHEPSKAKAKYQDVLKIDPINAVAKEKLKSLK